MAKRAGRTADQGLIDAYIHFNNTVGVLVEVNCETDFVANTDEFRQLAKDLALHVASPSAPRWVSRDDVPTSVLERRAEDRRDAGAEAGKPENVVAKIVEGKIEAFFKDTVLLDQPFVKDDTKTIQQLLDETSARRPARRCRCGGSSGSSWARTRSKLTRPRGRPVPAAGGRIADTNG